MEKVRSVKAGVGLIGVESYGKYAIYGMSEDPNCVLLGKLFAKLPPIEGLDVVENFYVTKLTFKVSEYLNEDQKEQLKSIICTEFMQQVQAHDQINFTYELVNKQYTGDDLIEVDTYKLPNPEYKEEWA